ncbi:MAG: hypothetical protein ABSA27_19935 [Terriglobales bacterium]
MKILTEHSGRNKHGQALARVQCDCGRIFEPLFNNVKRGRTKSCGHCSDPAPVTAQPTVIEIPPETASTLERGSVAYLNDEIKRRIASLISTENQIRFLDGETAQQDATNLDTIKKRKAAAAYAKDLQQEIAALQVQKTKQKPQS